MPATSAYPPRRLRQGLLLVSLAAWTMLLTGGSWLSLPAYCGASARFAAPGWDGLELALVLNPPGRLAAAWLMMLLAMMPLMLERPLAALLEGRFRRRASLFLVGYGAVWMAAGGVLILLAIGLSPAAALLAALAWQVSPWKQYCLGRCGGLAAGQDALSFGLAHGGWCVGACWALMVLPLTIEQGHHAAMALVALFLAVERQGWPRLPVLRLGRVSP